MDLFINFMEFALGLAALFLCMLLLVPIMILFKVISALSKDEE